MIFRRLMNAKTPHAPSPRQRRLESDLRRLQDLAQQSSIFSFEVAHAHPAVGAPETYRIRFRGPSLQVLTSKRGELIVQRLLEHEVLIQLVAEYPRSAPHMRWLTPIFHPNISAAGAVCLGGWGTHWAPSLQLDKLCEMLWDMLRFANYDTRSPFNQQAAQWLRVQGEYRFPLDFRELRDLADAPLAVSPGQPLHKYQDIPQEMTFEARLIPETDLQGEEIQFGTPIDHFNGQVPRPSPSPVPRPHQAPDIVFFD